MGIKEGDKLPEGTFFAWDADSEKPHKVNAHELLAGKTAVIFGIPGAFTPGCTATHCPAYSADALKLKDAGVEHVAMVAVNDIFVLHAFENFLKSQGKFQMLADGNGTFGRALGLELDATANGLGKRTRRFALLLDDLVVKYVGLDDMDAVIPSAIIPLLKSSSL